ncbi:MULTISPECIES: nitrilase-related carbon-nitrogen hydrolase [Prauserella salsuginis group]|uniref:Nitrilase-related carbon-nitrogen hydrolase n=1 Tax=Prauserella salsuginis TaxID=387889 RepID=A0ABW6FVW7_9PSEU|nr:MULTISPECIES: nitrilase-related carbon-nitrogen hydrolase [Prauserella salsuginis group]MCR3720124.1 carbon-nitrogen hydrolase family protein [Prauserella flava]MCR3734167.1 carbon-nitrogen hydrolase family protein [Prauserella salsuginis]
MRIALLQLASPGEESVEDRIARVTGMVDAEHELADTDLLVLPEMWTAGYFSFEQYAARAEPFEGPTLAAARTWARTFDLLVHLGSFVEAGADGRLHNTSAVVAPDGTVVTAYRKVHLFGYGSRESELLTPGDQLGVGHVGGPTAGITTCYDLRFPELFRSLVDEGAEQLLVCAAWPAARLSHWRLFTSVRAVEQQAILIACNAVGEQHGVVLGGHSRVVTPTGEVLVEAGTEEGFTYADVDPALPRQARAEFSALADRRWPVPAPVPTS